MFRLYDLLSLLVLCPRDLLLLFVDTAASRSLGMVYVLSMSCRATRECDCTPKQGVT